MASGTATMSPWRIVAVVVLVLCVIAFALIAKLRYDLAHMDLGKIVIYKEGVGPGFDEAAEGGVE